MGKNKLNGSESVNSVNGVLYNKIQLDSKTKELPYNKINKIVNENEVFDQERLKSTKYRLTVKIDTLISNSLFNATGENSWETFTKPIMRDRSYPPNEISVNESEDFSISESINYHLKEVNGWFGYYDPAINSSNRYKFNDIEPSRDKFNLVSEGDNNWDIIICYPKRNIMNATINGGLSIIDYEEVNVGGKVMVSFGTPYKHNLKIGDKVKLKGVGPDGIYQVEGVGLNSNHKDNYFALSLNIEDIFIGNNSKFCKIISGVESVYYFKVLSPINTINGNKFNTKSGEISNLSFSKNIYNDSITQFITKEDVDVEGLFDNLRRPLTEIFFTIIKKDNKGFGQISNGLDINHINGIVNYPEIPNIYRVHNSVDDQPFTPSISISNNIKIGDDEFIGDLVEYNKMVLKETILCDMMHRFNTINRESPSNDLVFGEGKRHEGYIYKPFHMIRLKEFSNYIEKGDNNTYGIPNYAQQLANGEYIWRDLMTVDDLDYPFTNGCSYIYEDIMLSVKRQDPFNEENLIFGHPDHLFRDISGEEVNENDKIKSSGDGC